uniref:Uncharacterized protein n=1 Tax=Pristionchus pacificus TaxID=54126 RepID=A0A2A6CGX7_PRIPA|eukprot:PDM77356.1 hypothetical protein PRIPAC_33086 [Pristionchus pacificus]
MIPQDCKRRNVYRGANCRLRKEDYGRAATLVNRSAKPKRRHGVKVTTFKSTKMESDLNTIQQQ